MTSKELAEKTEMLSDEIWDFYVMLENWSKNKHQTDYEIAINLTRYVCYIFDNIQKLIEKPF